MLTMAIPEVDILAVCLFYSTVQYVLMYSAASTNVRGSRGGRFEGIVSWKLHNVFLGRALPFHLFRHFCC